MNLARMLAQAARQHGRRLAVMDAETNLTWADFADRARRATNLLADAGAGKGSRYGLVMKNSFRQAELLWGGYWGGAVPVPVNWRLAAPEIADILADADCRVLFLDPEFAALLDHPALSGWRERCVMVGAGAGLPEYDRLLANVRPAPMHDAAQDDEAILLYTGGTTGRSKGVRLSHGNLVVNGLQTGLALGVRESDVTLDIAPMFHAAGLCTNVASFLGGAHVYMRQFSPRDFLAAVERWRINYTVVVPSMIKMVLDEPEAQRYDRSSLRVLFYGSSPMPADWLRRALALFPDAEFNQGYGLTETSPILCILSNADHRDGVARNDPALLGAAGKPLAGVELRILDDRGEDAEVGEVTVRAPGVMLGYHNRPDETAAVLREGWFRTGDIGRVDADGRLVLLDRKKDMIISGGENVYSVEVEAVLSQHPGIAEAAVVGVPDDTLGEALLAVVVLRPGFALSADELIAHCRGRIGGYKVPRRFKFVDALPRSAVGKVLKNRLRDSCRG